jgi:hypothetical protein
VRKITNKTTGVTFLSFIKVNYILLFFIILFMKPIKKHDIAMDLMGFETISVLKMRSNLINYKTIKKFEW